MRTSSSRGSQPVPLGQAPYKIIKNRVRRGLVTHEIVHDWETTVSHQPVGDPFVVEGTAWQFLAEKLSTSIRLHVAALNVETGELIGETALPLSAQSTLDEAKALSSTETGVVPTFASGYLGDDFTHGLGLVENAGYLKGFLIHRPDPDDLGSPAYVIPQMSQSPQLVCWRFTGSEVSTVWTMLGPAGLPTEYRIFSAVVLDPRADQQHLLVHFESWAWQSAANLFTDHIPSEGEPPENYLCGFRDYETALPIIPGELCQPEDTADYDGWSREEGNTSYAEAFHADYIETITNTRDHFDGNSGPGYWTTISTSKAPRWHRHGYTVINPVTGVTTAEKYIKILEGEASVPGGPLQVDSYRSEWVPPQTDPHDVASTHGFVVQEPGDATYDVNLKRGYTDQVDPDEESLYLFKEFIAWTSSDNPADDPETLTWFQNYGVSSPSLFGTGITTYSHWTFGAPSLYGNPQNFSTADTGVTFPWRFWISLVMKLSLVHWTQDESYRVPWHTCDAVCSGNRITFRARPWTNGQWREPEDDVDQAYVEGVNQIVAASSARPESYPLAVLDWDLNFNPDVSAANTQISTYATDAVQQKTGAEWDVDEVSEITVSNPIVHGLAVSETADSALNWWLERVDTSVTEGGEIILDEFGDPVLDGEGNPTFEPEVVVEATHCQIWAVSNNQTIRAEFVEVTEPAPLDVSGTGHQDAMIYRIEDVLPLSAEVVDGVIIDTIPLKSVLVVTEEGYADQYAPAGALWVGFVDNPATGTQIHE